MISELFIAIESYSSYKIEYPDSKVTLRDVFLELAKQRDKQAKVNKKAKKK